MVAANPAKSPFQSLPGKRSVAAKLAAARPGLKKLGAVSSSIVEVGLAEQLTWARIVVVERGPGRGRR